jgi:hypothetical protein
VEANWSNRNAFSRTCSRKVPVTGKPCRATRSAGRSAAARLIVPQSRSACCQVISVPGTPTDSPLVTATGNASGWPVAGSVNSDGPALAGVVSRPSIVDTWRVRAS